MNLHVHTRVQADNQKPNQVTNCETMTDHFLPDATASQEDMLKMIYPSILQDPTRTQWICRPQKDDPGLGLL